MPNALLVSPAQPPTYWGANFALEIMGVRAAFPPLGLLTVAAMFPPEYRLRVVDMNVAALEDSDLAWADMVFTSTMIVQRVSLQQVIERCNRAGVPVVAGGPHPTTFHDEIEGVDHFVLGEAEDVFPEFLRDLANGAAAAVYREPRKPDLTRTPVPRFDLIDPASYYSMSIQFSRGCPFDCEFCDITKLYGRVSRTKSPAQVVGELESLHRLGWRGAVFIVDDNFIGNKREAMRLLPVIAEWQKAHGYPFTLSTEASVNLARMDALMDGMSDAGFDSVFVGIETPTPKALLKTKKPQNVSTGEDDYLLNAVRKIQRKGMQVQAGFILGLDGDDEDVFDAQIAFIQEAGIPAAAIYLLTALRGTDMFSRLQSEGRLLDVPIGTSVMALNFETEMDADVLIEGYRRVTATLYDPTLENYFARCLTLFEHLEAVPHLLKPKSRNATFVELMGVRERLAPEQVPGYMKFVAEVSRKHPRMLPKAIQLAAQGYHYERVTRGAALLHEFKEFVAAERRRLRAEASTGRRRAEERELRESWARVEARHESIPGEFRYLGDGVEAAVESFRAEVGDRPEGTLRA